ncbi:Arabinanase/levansucrase/invertase [Desarmillaria ectypa]|nr:Arabinanase/levansucrase/invertase [Desarmillaria ectypa]
MRYIGGVYYMTSTQNTDISMWAATTVEGIKTATPTVLFTDTVAAGRNYDFWAPEYYAVAGNRDDNTHRLHVLSGGTDASNPMNGAYSHMASLIPSNFDFWAVDGSILELNGTRYFIFSGKTTDAVWTQCTYIVRMSSPTRLSGNAVQISCPTLSWETAATPVQEGPEAITIGGVTHVRHFPVYWLSASHCSTDDYALGLLTLTTDANPLLASSWTKATSPLFTKNVAAGVYGPGHHFMFEKDGEHLFAYHGKSKPGLGCGDLRTTRVQPFGINGTTPVFPAVVGDGIAVAEP